MIYFDNAATTKASEEVAKKNDRKCFCYNFGNPASVNKLGLQVEKEIRKVTEILSIGIHCKKKMKFIIHLEAQKEITGQFLVQQKDIKDKENI